MAYILSAKTNRNPEPPIFFGLGSLDKNELDLQSKQGEVRNKTSKGTTKRKEKIDDCKNKREIKSDSSNFRGETDINFQTFQEVAKCVQGRHFRIQNLERGVGFSRPRNEQNLSDIEAHLLRSNHQRGGVRARGEASELQNWKENQEGTRSEHPWSTDKESNDFSPRPTSTNVPGSQPGNSVATFPDLLTSRQRFWFCAETRAYKTGRGFQMGPPAGIRQGYGDRLGGTQDGETDRREKDTNSPPPFLELPQVDPFVQNPNRIFSLMYPQGILGTQFPQIRCAAPTTTWMPFRRDTTNHAAHLHGFPARLSRLTIDQYAAREVSRCLKYVGFGSGNELSSSAGVEIHEGENWPIYTPAVVPIQVQALRSYVDDQDILRWLDDKCIYENLLRRVPVKHRSQFNHTILPDQLKQLLDAGIIKEHLSEPKSFCKLFFVPEAHKCRRRVIFEPRDLNRCYKSLQFEKIQLPTMGDINDLVWESEMIESIDFTSFYYQIALDPTVQPYFSIYINNKLYALQVLPQGACFSVGVAQTISVGVAKRLIPVNSRFIVYIDNIYIGYDRITDESVFQGTQPFIIGSRSMASRLTILGLDVDCSSKLVDVKKQTRNKLSTLTRNSTLRHFFSAFGVFSFINRALHSPFALHYTALTIVCKVFSLFVQQSLNLDEKLGATDLSQHDLDAVNEALVLTSKLPPARATSRVAVSGELPVIFTDASLVGGAALLAGESGLEVVSWAWSQSAQCCSINMKELLAISAGIDFFQKQAMVIATDSQVAFATLRKGWSQAKHLNDVIKEILQRRAELWLTWIPSGKNFADLPSRFPLRMTLQDSDVKDIVLDHEAKVEKLWHGGKWTC